MRLFKIAVLLLIAFCSCKRNANRNDAPGYEYVVTVEYRNEYENDFLVNIYRKYKDEKSKYELTFTPDYDLVLSTETIEKDNEKIVITKSTEFEAVDSLFYLNNKEIRLVSASPDYRTTIINEYDLYGNISKETRIYSTVSRPVVHK